MMNDKFPNWVSKLPKTINHNNIRYSLIKTEVGDDTVFLYAHDATKLQCAGMCGSTKMIQSIAKELYIQLVYFKYVKPFKKYEEWLKIKWIFNAL